MQKAGVTGVFFLLLILRFFIEFAYLCSYDCNQEFDGRVFGQNSA